MVGIGKIGLKNLEARPPMRQFQPKSGPPFTWCLHLCPRAQTLLRLVAVSLIPLFFAACGSAVPHRRASLSPSGAGESWHAVLPSPVVTAYDEIGPHDLAYSRRDSELAIRSEATVNGVADSWPSPERPSLSQTRRLYLNNRPETVVYFRDSYQLRTYRTYAH